MAVNGKGKKGSSRARSTRQSPAAGAGRRTPAASGHTEAPSGRPRASAGQARRSVVLTDDTGHQIHVEVTLGGAQPADPLDAVKTVFGDELRSLLGDAVPDEDTVRRAARLAFAEQAWRQ